MAWGVCNVSVFGGQGSCLTPDYQRKYSSNKPKCHGSMSYLTIERMSGEGFGLIVSICWGSFFNNHLDSLSIVLVRGDLIALGIRDLGNG